MASVTPRKKIETMCVVCSSATRRLFNLNNNKCRSENALLNLQKIYDDIKLIKRVDLITICEKCLTYVGEHVAKVEILKTNVDRLINDGNPVVKRCASTPRTPRIKVVDSLISSVEKLKKLKLTGTAEMTQKTSRKKISFEDHTYSSLAQKRFEEITLSSGEDSYAKSASVEDCLRLDAELSVRNYPISDTLSEIDKKLQSMASKTSVLCPKSLLDVTDTSLFNSAVMELKRGCPFLFDMLVVAFSKIDNPLSKITMIATVYGMILHSRNNKVSAIQRLFSTVVLAYGADNRLLTKLNSIHLTLTEHSKRSLISSYGRVAEEKLLLSILAGHDGKFNGDNLDIRVHTNDIRLGSKDKDYHFFASDFTTDRINLDGLNKTTPNIDNLNLTVTDFIPKPDETKYFKETLKLLLARELMQFKGFSWMKSLVPTHIPHEYEDDMAKKSDVFVLPVSLNNEARYQDCIHIMDEYEHYLNSWYGKTARGGDLHELHVPVGGDQLTRVRLQGAKALRAGAHTKSERFDHLHPIIIEMFHTLQDFLEKLCKKFLDPKLARDPGTLPNLKIVIERVNVNGNVKSRFKAHEDFVTTCGISYVYDYILTKFEMDTMNDLPKHPSIKETISSWTNEPKRKVFNQVMDEIMADLFIPFDIKEPVLNIAVTVGQQSFNVTVEQQQSIQIPLIINNIRYKITATVEDLRKGIKVQISGINIHLKTTVAQVTNNALKRYVTNFLQWYFTILQMKDAIKEGDMKRTNIILKNMIPFFYSHSVLSKYLVECIDYILKTEHILSPYMSLKVRAATFVNLKGKPGKNKAADIQKENEVKSLKGLIRSLGANKTEQSITSITKAGPVMLDIAETFDEMTGTQKIKSTHKMKNRENDTKELVRKLRKLKLWDDHQVNHLSTNVSKTPFEFDRGLFKRTVMSKVQQLLMDVPILEEEDET